MKLRHTSERARPGSRAAAAVAGAAFVLVLSACGGPTQAADPGADVTPSVSSDATGTDRTASPEATSPASADAGSATSGSYTDGSYTATGSYQTPETVETVTVTLSLADDVITSVEVTGDPQARESEQYQGQFIGGIADEVVGKPLDEVSVSRVAGSSLTSGGFTKALEAIKAEAAA